MKNIEPDPDAQNRAFCVLLPVREFYTSEQLFVYCRMSVRAFITPRCPRCGQLMLRVET